jgi:hypothetical protein
LTGCGKIANSQLSLKFHSYIDPRYVADAENDIKTFVKDNELDFKYKNNKEIIIIRPDLLDRLKEQYEIIGKDYKGRISDILDKIKDLEHKLELEKVKYENELLKKIWKFSSATCAR